MHCHELLEMLYIEGKSRDGRKLCVSVYDCVYVCYVWKGLSCLATFTRYDPRLVVRFLMG